jgi:cytochrome c-type biogenesis protein CcmH/NrfG
MPEDAETRLCVGIALLHVGTDPEGAIDELQVALRLDPASARGYGALGSALHALGEYPESAAAFAEAARLDPEFLANRPATQALEAASRAGEAWPPLVLP